MDPSLMGGASVDPSMMGGAPGGAPVDPSMTGGAPMPPGEDGGSSSQVVQLKLEDLIQIFQLVAGGGAGAAPPSPQSAPAAAPAPAPAPSPAPVPAPAESGKKGKDAKLDEVSAKLDQLISTLQGMGIPVVGSPTAAPAPAPAPGGLPAPVPPAGGAGMTISAALNSGARRLVLSELVRTLRRGSGA